MSKLYSFLYRAALLFLLIFFTPFTALATIHIVAAENFYGDIAQQLGGDYVTVHSILQNPAQDPHTFSANPSIAKLLADADIVVLNGLGYDDWMWRLLSTQGKENRRVLSIDGLISSTKPGNDPHIWYMPTTMGIYASALAYVLIHR